jgi:hypothetical protein
MSSKDGSQEKIAQYTATHIHDKKQGIICYARCPVEGQDMLVIALNASLHIIEYKYGSIGNFSKVSYETLIAGSFSERGGKNGEGKEATFNSINAICASGGKTVFVCDGNTIRSVQMTSPFIVDTVCGDGLGYKKLVHVSLDFPCSICVDQNHNIYVLDREQSRIYKINAQRTCGTVFYDNDTYYGSYKDQWRKKRRTDDFLNKPTMIKVMNNTHLVVLNQGENSFCKISLISSPRDNSRHISIIKKSDSTIHNFDCAENGDIVFCMRKKDFTSLSFYSIKIDGTETLIANKSLQNIMYVMDLQIRPGNAIHPTSFDTMDFHIKDIGSEYLMTSTSFKLNWKLLRVIFTACFKPISSPSHLTPNLFALLPHDDNGGKSSPLLRKIIEFVNIIY